MTTDKREGLAGHMTAGCEPTGNGGILGEGVVSSKENLVTGRGMGGRFRPADERGQALVEFVLLLPVFLIITFGIIEFGRAFNYWIDTTHLASEGARYAAVNRWPTCPANDLTACPETLKHYLGDRANTGELAKGDDSGNVSGGALEDQINICYPEGSGLAGNAVKVTVKTQYTLKIVDGLFSAIGIDDVGTINLGASATQRVERNPTANRLGAEVTACP
jgi:Flp pilus assembly protein TadG